MNSPASADSGNPHKKEAELSSAQGPGAGTPHHQSFWLWVLCLFLPAVREAFACSLSPVDVA